MGLLSLLFQFSVGGDFVPLGHLAISRDILFVVTVDEGGATGS